MFDLSLAYHLALVAVAAALSPVVFWANLQLSTLGVAMIIVATVYTSCVHPAYGVLTLLVAAIILSLVLLARFLARSRAAIVACLLQAQLVVRTNYGWWGFWLCLLGYRLWVLGPVMMQLWIIEEFIIVCLCWIIWSRAKGLGLRPLLQLLVFWPSASEVDWEALLERAYNFAATVILPAVLKVSLFLFQVLVILSSWCWETFKSIVRWWSPRSFLSLEYMSLWERLIYKDWIIAERRKRDAKFLALPIPNRVRPKDDLTIQKEKAEEASKAQARAELRDIFRKIQEDQAREARLAEEKRLQEEARASMESQHLFIVSNHNKWERQQQKRKMEEQAAAERAATERSVPTPGDPNVPVGEAIDRSEWLPSTLGDQDQSAQTQVPRPVPSFPVVMDAPRYEPADIEMGNTIDIEAVDDSMDIDMAPSSHPSSAFFSSASPVTFAPVPTPEFIPAPLDPLVDNLTELFAAGQSLDCPSEREAEEMDWESDTTDSDGDELMPDFSFAAPGFPVATATPTIPSEACKNLRPATFAELIRNFDRLPKEIQPGLLQQLELYKKLGLWSP
ncbi:hypothetical protein HD806DRAFT_534222 [Xylariaceae sp. AK1471]|nr:hypothetical protein HD806DRAFT_534222 [Xylariaceae sp. AK1471]